MKKRLVSFLLLLSILLSTPLYPTKALAANETDFNPLTYRSPDISAMTGLDIVGVIDEEMHLLYEKDYQVPDNFYGQYDGPRGRIRYKWLEDSAKHYRELFELPFLRSPVVYDPSDPDWPPDKIPFVDYSIGNIVINFAGKGPLKVPVWGKDYYKRPYIDWDRSEDAAYWFEHGWSGYRLNGNFWNDIGKRTVLKYDKALGILLETDITRHNLYFNCIFKNMKTIPGFPDNFLDELIQYGVDEIWGGKQGKDVDFRSGSAQLQRRDGYVHRAGERPSDIKWHDCVLVMIPPTYISWGSGVRFSVEGGNTNIVYTMDIPIAPINMLLNDLSARFADPPTRAKPGDRVAMTVTASSFFTTDVATDYEWSIPGATEIKIEAASHAPGFTSKIAGSKVTGDITIPAMGAVDIRISFIMPEAGARAAFVINPYETIPENGNYSNNKAEHYVAPDIAKPGTVNIPAWVLTQEVAFSLVSSATLSLPYGDWTGNATGGLAISTESDIYNDFAVTNNPAVDEASTMITRQPEVTAMLDRADFGDDPKNGAYATNGTLSRTAAVTGSGKVTRPYWLESGYEGEDGIWVDTSEGGDATADFDGPAIDDRRTYIFDVFNGTKDIPFRKTFQDKADKSAIINNGVTYDLAWEGTTIPTDH